MKIKVFVTGGTFDKEYNDLDGQLFFKNTHIHEILELGRSRIDVDIETLMMIDSLDMTEEDREKIAQSCLGANEDNIVITHGTDTMVETANVLAKKVKNKNTFLSWTLFDFRKKNKISQNPKWASEHPTMDHYVICPFPYLPKNEQERLNSLPAADYLSGSKSDFCE